MTGTARRRFLAGWLPALLLVGSVTTAPAAELTFDIKLVQGRAPDNMQLIRVHEGDAVTLRWTTDRPLVVHLHGYDIEQRLAVGGVTELAFTAFATGRFPVHVHQPGERAAAHAHEDAPLVTIEVYPR